MPWWVGNDLDGNFAAWDPSGVKSGEILVPQTRRRRRPGQHPVQNRQRVLRPPTHFRLVASLQTVQLVHYDHRDEQVNRLVPRCEDFTKVQLLKLVGLAENSGVSDDKPSRTGPLLVERRTNHPTDLLLDH